MATPRYLQDEETQIPAYLQDVPAPPPVQEPGYAQTGLISLVRGGAGIVSGAGAATEWAGDVLRAEELKEAGRGLRGVAQRVIESPAGRLEGPTFEGTFMEKPSLKRAFGIVGEAVPSLGLALATGGGAALGLRGLGVAASRALQVGSAVAAGGLGLIEGAPQYIEAREAGKPLGTASVIGTAATVGTAALEFLGLNKLFGLVGKGALRGAATGLISEGAQEGTQQLWQNIVAKVGYDSSRSLVDGMAEAIIGGAGAGGLAGAVTGRIGVAQDAKNDRAAEQLLTNIIPGSQVIVENGVATVSQETEVGQTTITAKVDDISKSLAAGVTPEELAAASDTMRVGVEAVKDQVPVEEEPTQIFTRLEDTPTEIRYNIRGVDYAYTAPEDMTKQELETAIEGKSDSAAIQWLKQNAEVEKLEVQDVITQPVTEEEITPPPPDAVTQEAVAEPAAPIEGAQVVGPEQESIVPLTEPGEIQQAATIVDPSLSYDGESEGIHFFTPSEGPSRGGTFAVRAPTEEKIKQALTASQQKFAEAPEQLPGVLIESKTTPEAKAEKEKAAPTGTTNFVKSLQQQGAQVVIDNPKGTWLAEQQERAAKKDKETGMRHGALTAKIDKIELRVSDVRQLKGISDEHTRIKSKDKKVVSIAKSIKEKGYDRDKPIFINVGHDGTALISEGNHRIRAAERADIDIVPVEIAYFAGGEEASGPMSLERVALTGYPLRAKKTTAKEEKAAPERVREVQPTIEPIEATIPRTVFAKVSDTIKTGQQKVKTAISALSNPKAKAYDLYVQHAPTWLSVTPLHTLVQTFGKSIPQIRNFSNHLDAVVADKTEIVDTSAVIHDKAETLAKAGVGVDTLNRAAATASFNRMTPWEDMYTQAWVPKKGTKEQRLKAAQKAWVKAQMQKATGFTYLQAYAETQKAYNDLKTTGLKDAYIQIVEHIASVRIRERNNLLAYIESVSEKGTDLRRDLMQQFTTSFSNLYGAYWPLSRVGDFILEHVDADGFRQVEHFTAVSERASAKANLIEQGIDPSTIKEDFKNQHPKGAIAIPQMLMGQLAAAVEEKYMQGVNPDNTDAVDTAKQRAQEVVNDMNQIWLRWQPETSALKNSVKRKNIKGFSTDMLRSYLGYMQRHASSIAWTEQGRKIEQDIQSFADIIDEQKQVGNVDVTMQRHLLNDLRNRIQALQSVSVGPVASMFGKLGTAYYMTSPSIALVQMSQLGVLTFPKLAVKYSPAKATKALAKGTKEAFKPKFTREPMFADPKVNVVYGNLRAVVTDENKNTPPARGKDIGDRLFSDEQILKQYEGLSAYQKQLLTLREAMARNLLDISAAHEAYELTRGKDPKNLRSRIFNFAMLPMSLSELTSRKATVLSTLELTQQQGKNFFESMTDIADVVNDTLYSYSKEAKGSAMQGGLVRVILQFQHYRIMTGLRLALLFNRSIRGESSEVKKAAAKEFIGIMGMTGMLAGTVGIPLSQQLFAILDLVLGDDDEPMDSQLVFTNWLQESLGETAGDVAAYGLPTLSGMNISRRIGLADIYGFQNEPPTGMSGRNLAAWWAASQLGPIFSVGQGWFQGYDEIINKGNYMKGLEVATPKPIRDALKALRIGTEGLKTSQGKRLLSEEEIGANEIVMLAMGFNADEVAKAQAAERSLRKISTKISKRRGKLIKNAARAIIEASADDEAFAAIRRFNKKMPRFSVTGSDVRPAVRKIIRGEFGATGRREMSVAEEYDIPVYMQ